MAKVLPFPHTGVSAASIAMQNMEKRLGVSFSDYMGTGAGRSEETQKQIDKAMRKETFQLASKLSN
ncbi:hypothetical protein M5X00_13230 [Paenibacillus alvei]|uniref:hypothetical protein n=1 Tax=Paenibacillus alvei TaxID=44250 RepID=UPI000287E233|nr:hypothetical protein [Paenibacillus alvei]EJW13783.1 hypothetical protein PAV_109p00130 [Paenibacillus alvei DSM 29]MCY9540514.1 hypothetical protein [Paenibacillus alvei]MCY9708282.1 hypothetical protein [Paenibacillus alvei]MCY9732923.1 hypothetical protein [Paenibacillus alvei]MCY9755203.1 hypothetical protein [Paenibacillus alvei]